MSDPSDDRALAVLETARTPFEAQVIAAVLRAADIPAFVGGSFLTDEFAASQRLMGLGGVRVQVPHHRLDEARAALAEARAVGRELEDDALPEAEPEVEPEAFVQFRRPAPRRARWPVAVAGFVAGAATVGIVVQARGTDDIAPYRYEAVRDGHRYRWRDNDATALQTVDADRDGVAEVQHVHNRVGQRVYSAYDADQDGMVERTATYGPDGRVATEAFDADGDGRFETVREHVAGGLRLWLDDDGDGRTDRVEAWDATNVRRHVWRIEPDGFVEVK